MKFTNRFVKMMVATAIVGLISAQVPTQSSVALAQDGYNTETGFFDKTEGKVLVGVFLIGGVLVATGVIGGAGAAAAGAGAGAEETESVGEVRFESVSIK